MPDEGDARSASTTGGDPLNIFPAENQAAGGDSACADRRVFSDKIRAVERVHPQKQPAATGDERSD